jgi:transposase-like protein
VRRNLLPSVEIEKEIDALLAGERVEVHPLEVVGELGKLGVRLVLQRAVAEEVDDWLGRARYQRRAEAAPGKRNGCRPRRLQTGEGEIVVEVP